MEFLVRWWNRQPHGRIGASFKLKANHPSQIVSESHRIVSVRVGQNRPSGHLCNITKTIGRPVVLDALHRYEWRPTKSSCVFRHSNRLYPMEAWPTKSEFAVISKKTSAVLTKLQDHEPNAFGRDLERDLRWLQIFPNQTSPSSPSYFDPF